MSIKTTFKRLALVVVAALGMGALSVAPSNAVVNNVAGDITFSASSTSGTAGQGETATTVITLSYTSTLANESLTITTDSASAHISPVLVFQTADSVNVNTSTSSGVGVERPVRTPTTDIPTGANLASNSGSTSPTFVSGKFNLNFKVGASTPAGTYVYTVALYAATAGSAGFSSSLLRTFTYTLTVTAKDLTATAAKSLMWLNGAAGSEGALCGVDNASCLAGTTRAADSALVVSANTALPNAVQAFNNAKAYIHWDPRNAGDTNIVTGDNVTGTLTLQITGAGQLAKASTPSTYSNQVTLDRGETAIVYSNGVAGTATLTGRIGNTALTQAAKTITFYGKATSLVASTGAWDDFGGNLSSVAADSVNTGIVTFVAKDANGTVVKSAAMQNSLGNFYVISSDTKIASANARALFTTCSLSVASTGTWSCDMNTNDSGTATLTIADSTTVATASVSSSAVPITVAGAAFTATVAFDKATYQPNELAIITVTVKDRAGRNIKDVNGAAVSGLFTTIKAGDDVQNKPFSSVKTNFGFGDLTKTSWDWSGNRTVFGGLETFVVYMPSTSGNVTIGNLATSYDSSTLYTAITATATVIDSAEEAANSALDAAQEATDAAIAATDAAILAQEAADEAASAAIAAQETAQLAVDAVTALSAEVTKLVAQLATLQKLLNRVAKRVGVKL